MTTRVDSGGRIKSVVDYDRKTDSKIEMQLSSVFSSEILQPPNTIMTLIEQ